MTASWHGTRTGYGHHRCRCKRCREANRMHAVEYRAKPLAEKNLTHGTAGSYGQGCRCRECRAAYSEYRKEWKAWRKSREAK